MMTMLISPLIEAKAELTDGGLPAEPIVLSTRIRLARNFADYPFPGWATEEQRGQVLQQAFDKSKQTETLGDAMYWKMEDLSALEAQVLLERRLVSRELTEADPGAGIIISQDQRIAIMVNEEDHLRLQVVRSGFNLNKTWEEINRLDYELEEGINYAFDDDFGYLTACPTNVGTGIRASAMLHLPGLVMQEHMEKVIRMVNQLGMAVRGNFGEGSEATGSIFQISNQQTLGESEEAIIKRLINVLHAIIEQEQNARALLLEKKSDRLFDKIGRANGILRNARILSSDEAVNLLSLMRLGVDLNMLSSNYREVIDRLTMEIQPGHVQYTAQSEIAPDERDKIRADRIREQLTQFPALDYNKVKPNSQRSS